MTIHDPETPAQREAFRRTARPRGRVTITLTPFEQGAIASAAALHAVEYEDDGCVGDRREIRALDRVLDKIAEAGR